MSKLDYEISEKYTSEIEDIRCKLNQLENGKIKEFTGAKQDGNLDTNIKKLREMINDLLYKIQNGEKGDKDKLIEKMKRIYG